MSLVLYSILLAYIALKSYIFETGKDTEYLTYELDYFYRDEIFTSKDGLHVAFALTEYDAV